MGGGVKSSRTRERFSHGTTFIRGQIQEEALSDSWPGVAGVCALGLEQTR